MRSIRWDKYIDNPQFSVLWNGGFYERIKIDKDGSKPSSKSVTGYSILKAASMAEAKKLLKGHPHLMYSKTCSIEVHEAMPLPG